ncbi:MAG: LytTR family DNA-binding domain-containing protein [Atopobiaceae bacterium]|jgi:DNA-binding LytR/AlgR family response regulator|nr:LytTR family DNA-binding domain-containing protein [Atopobiaceae bacterium]MCI2173810.1 LytTR family DNA-binding domain-containing protein [Atopobiaceae bacterium]MCI2207548.1 LytTR family DNA-binding domain-containing protein [Atopobiaceae bacterium]
MQVAICDGKTNELSSLTGFVRQLFASKRIPLTCYSFADGALLLEALNNSGSKPDIIVLDVDVEPGKGVSAAHSGVDDPMLPEAPGIVLGHRLRASGFSGILVFVSRTTDQTLPAFDVGAFNYALKGGESQESNRSRFEHIMLKAAATVLKRGRRYLLLDGVDRRCNVAIDSIRYFEVGRRLVTCHYADDDGADQEFEFVSTLDKVEVKLANFGFIRCHRAYVVNLGYVVRCSASELELMDGTSIPVGRSKREAVSQAFSQLTGGHPKEDLRVVGPDGRNV